MMDINASLIDQRVTGIVAEYEKQLPKGSDNPKKRSAAFVLLCIATWLDISIIEAEELLTDGGNDAGVDGLHLGDVDDGEFLVTLFQGKYKINDLSGTANFPENGVEKAINTVQVLFNPYRKVVLNDKIRPKIEEIRSLIQDGLIPKVNIILCNNGARWIEPANRWIESAKSDYGDKVDFFHFNHDDIVNRLQRRKKVDATLNLSGQAIVEDMNYLRVLVGRVSVQEIQRLFNDHGDRLLERNIRRYLGLHTNRVNTAIHETLLDPQKSDKFYFCNNGITVVCDQFNYNAFQKSDYKVQFKNLQVINGGQTCKTIQTTLNQTVIPIANAFVMLRAYQLADTDQNFVHDITYATNHQNPVDLRDLRSNNPLQKQLELGLDALGYTYKRQREEGAINPKILTSAVVAESVLAIWREKPHQAKFNRREHFGRLYDDIFKGLNAAQAVLAVLIFRWVENERKQPVIEPIPEFLPYASHYIAMMFGRELLKSHDLDFSAISHRNFPELLQSLETQWEVYYKTARIQVADALKQCYGERAISLQQLAATFRRGDLLEMLRAKA